MGRASLKEVILNPAKIIKHLGGKGHFKWIPDELYLRICYRAAFGKKLNLKDPKGFNEKLQWLKLYDHNPIYTTMVDKSTAKDYVANIIGEQYTIPTYGVWDKFEDIDFDSLPEQFVLKCTHDSGGLVICKNKAELDMQAAKRKIESSLKRQFYYVGREWAYKDVKPRIIAEKLMTESDVQDLKDYKLMVFGGKVKCSFVCTERHSERGVHINFYDTDWELMPFERHYPRSEETIEKPVSYDEMVELAEKLAHKLPFVRVDFYEIQGRPFFGELTLYPGDGFEEFNPEKYDDILGSWIKLPGGKFLIQNI